MEWIIAIWQRITSWLFGTKRPLAYKVSMIEDIPHEPRLKTFYLVGAPQHVWCGVMACPCGCGEVIHLNLLPEGRPKWNYEITPDGTVTIHPSIWRTKGCRSHFFLRQGQIHWCNQSPTTNA